MAGTTTFVAGGPVDTTTVTCAHAVLPHVPSALTKYVVVTVGETLMVVPLPTVVPEHVPLRHTQLAPEPSTPPITVRLVLPQHIFHRIAH